MKLVSILIPTYNEEENVTLIYNRILKLFGTELENYAYEIIFIDNYSQDNTREKLKELAIKDKNVKLIFNMRNFGFSKSLYHGVIQTHGDCTIIIFADMQDPPELIPKFLEEWEKGYKIVVGIKNKSKENKIMYFIRSFYYKLIKKIAEIDHIEHFTGFGLYDKSFITILKNLNDPMPYLRGIVAEFGGRRQEIYYEQKKRENGKSSFNFFKLYDVAMLGVTSYSKVPLRIATFLGIIIGIISFIIAVITFILKLLFWNRYPMGLAAVSIGLFFFSSVQLFFIGLLGEYIANINERLLSRPLVIEEERINFEK